jgi:hypothetical protein
MGQPKSYLCHAVFCALSARGKFFVGLNSYLNCVLLKTVCFVCLMCGESCNGTYKESMILTVQMCSLL